MPMTYEVVKNTLDKLRNESELELKITSGEEEKVIRVCVRGVVTNVEELKV